LPEEILQHAPKWPILRSLADAIEIGLAHVATIGEQPALGVEMKPVLEIGGKRKTVGQPVELDEVIHLTSSENDYLTNNPPIPWIRSIRAISNRVTFRPEDHAKLSIAWKVSIGGVSPEETSHLNSLSAISSMQSGRFFKIYGFVRARGEFPAIRDSRSTFTSPEVGMSRAE
jgi:hypothetical protein